MNKLQIKELLAKHHPHLSNRLADLYLKMAADRIAEETTITKKTFVLSSVAGQRWYNLDASILKIDKVLFNDVLIPKLIGEPIIDDDEFASPADSADTALATPTANSENKRFWMLSNYDSSDSTTKTSRLGIVEKVGNVITRDGRTSNFQSCSVTGTTNIRIYANAISDEFSVSDDATLATVGPLKDIPPQFHEVILNGAIARGYKDPENINADMLSFFEGEFESGIKRIKKFERTRTTTGFIKPYDF